LCRSGRLKYKELSSGKLPLGKRLKKTRKKI
jgi:hypothetical protein